jgi:hypothetical protein
MKDYFLNDFNGYFIFQFSNKKLLVFKLIEE